MQFTLRTLLLLFVVAAAALALRGPWGLLAVAYLACVIVGFRVASYRIPSCANIVILVLLLMPLGYVVLSPAVISRPWVGQHIYCLNNMKQLGLALHKYHDQYGCFPPACVRDAKGKPMHSWRVLLLPYLDESNVYQAYRLNEPWDSPNNRTVAAATPPWFRCPGDSNPKPGTTDYVAITGEGTAWPEKGSVSLRDITDGASDTVMVVEVVESNIPWNAPGDLPLNKALSDPECVPLMGARHPPGSRVPMGNVLYADGRTECLFSRLTPGSLKAVCTIAGRERSSFEDLQFIPDDPPYAAHTFWSGLIGLVVLVVSFVFLVTRPLPEAWKRRPGENLAPRQERFPG